MRRERRAVSRAIYAALAISIIYLGDKGLAETNSGSIKEQRALCVAMLTAVTSPKMIDMLSNEQLLHDLCDMNFGIAALANALLRPRSAGHYSKF